MSKMLADAGPVQAAPLVQAAPWVNRWVDIEPPPIDVRWVDIVQVAPPLPTVEREPELVTPRGLVMVIITIILTLMFFDVRWKNKVGGTQSSTALIDGLLDATGVVRGGFA